MKKFAVFDTETTGLPYHRKAPLKMQPRIVEFAGIITDGHEILHTLEFVVNPGIAIEAIITQITGFTNEDLEDKPDFGLYVDDLRRFFEMADFSIAHNHSFDTAMLRYDLARRDLTLDDICMPKPICTVEETFHKYGRRMTLEELYNMLCGEYVQKHRALDDVKLLHQVAAKVGVYDAFSNYKEAV